MDSHVEVTNLGQQGTLRRWKMGFVMGGVSAGLSAVLVLTEAHWSLRLVLFFPLWLSVLGFLQAWKKT